jgi:hypothetical protein
VPLDSVLLSLVAGAPVCCAEVSLVDDGAALEDVLLSLANGIEPLVSVVVCCAAVVWSDSAYAKPTPATSAAAVVIAIKALGSIISNSFDRPRGGTMRGKRRAG